MNDANKNRKPFSVNLFGSDPDLGNDDCWTGDDFETRAEADTAYTNPAAVGGYFAASLKDSEYIVLMELTGTDHLGRPEYTILDKRVNPTFKPRRQRDDDSAWRSEIAMQAGMIGGCAAYNEVMGY